MTVSLLQQKLLRYKQRTLGGHVFPYMKNTCVQQEREVNPYTDEQESYLSPIILFESLLRPSFI